MTIENYKFFSNAIKKGAYDENYGYGGNKQLIADTDPFVYRGTLSREEQKSLFKELSFRSSKLITNKSSDL